MAMPTSLKIFKEVGIVPISIISFRSIGTRQLYKPELPRHDTKLIHHQIFRSHGFKMVLA
jgi:hypothetical protein